jgi:hypothetical protein
MSSSTLVAREFEGFVIQQRRVDGYINLNQMAKACGKRIDNWMRLKETTSLLREFAQSLEYEGLIPVITIEGRHGGSWGHPDIAVQFAQWCSPSFALQVSRWIHEWLLTGKNPIHADDLKRLNLRRQLKDQDRLYLTDQLKAYLEKRGEYSSVNPHRLFSQIHDAINRVLTGETSKQMYQRTGLKSHQLLRDYFPLEKLNHYSALTISIANYILDGYEPVEAVHLAANQALPRPFKAEPIELVEPVKALEQKLFEKMLPPKKH